jgi:integrase
MTIGRYPTLGLAQAREIAKDALVDIHKGIDPLERPTSASDAPAVRVTKAFSVVAERYITEYLNRRNKASTAKETARILRTDFERHWSKHNIANLSRMQVRARLEDILAKGTPSAATHAFAAIRAFFNWCVREGHLEVSPCLGLEKPARHASRDRVLTDQELMCVWQAAGEIGWPLGPIVHLLIMTAQRRGEVAGMRWQDVDLPSGLWTIPGELTKSNRAHSVPLTSFSRNLILTLPRLHDTWVFPARGDIDRPYIGFNKGKKRLDACLNLAPWTLHDLRRTTATGMAKRKVPPHVVERLLNHTTGTLGGVAGVYNRFGYLDEMREALELWEKHLTILIDTSKIDRGAIASTDAAG